MAHFEVRKNFKLSDKDFKGKFGRDKPNTDTEIIIYCREGRRAQDATMAFIELGYREVSKFYENLKNLPFETFKQKS